MSRPLALGLAVLALGLGLSSWLLLRDRGRFTPLAEAAGAEAGGELALLFVGGLEGYLEPCGCNRFQSGGVVNLAAVLDDERRRARDVLAVGVPGLFAGEGPLNRKKNEFVLQAVEQLGLDALVVGAEELSFSTPLVRRYLRARAPLLSADLEGVPGLRRRVAGSVGGVPVVLTALTGDLPEAVRTQLSLRSAGPLAAAVRGLGPAGDGPAVRILVSAAPEDMTVKVARQLPGLDLVVLLEGGEGPLPDLGGTRLHRLESVSRGRALQRLVLAVDAAGQVASVDAAHVDVVVGRTHPKVEAVVARFYREVGADPAFAAEVVPRCGRCAEERAPGARYAGAESCRGCHAAEYFDWHASPHARAFLTLANAQRQYSPECLVCHTTGMGLDTGFQFSDGFNSALKDVQCEVCHGPAGAHLAHPAKDNVRRAPPPALCRECHTPERHPGFAGREDHYLAKVNHRSAPAAAGAGGPADAYSGRMAAGRHLFTAGAFLEAAEAFDEAARLRPGDVDARAEAGWALVQDGLPHVHHERGLAALEGLVRAHPGHARSRYYLGRVWMQTEDRREEALAELLRARELGLDGPELVYQLGHAYLGALRGIADAERLGLAVESFRAARDGGWKLSAHEFGGSWSFIALYEEMAAQAGSAGLHPSVPVGGGGGR